MTHDNRFATEGLTFDDVLLVPAMSEVLPRDCDTTTVLAGDRSMCRCLVRAWTP